MQIDDVVGHASKSLGDLPSIRTSAPLQHLSRLHRREPCLASETLAFEMRRVTRLIKHVDQQ